MSDDDWMLAGHKPTAAAAGAGKILKTFWTMQGEGRTATAILVPHPLGVEVRILEGAELRRSQAHRDVLKAEVDAADTYARLRARGWEPIEA